MSVLFQYNSVLLAKNITKSLNGGLQLRGLGSLGYEHGFASLTYLHFLPTLQGSRGQSLTMAVRNTFVKWPR